MKSKYRIETLLPGNTDKLMQFYLSLPPWIINWFEPFPTPEAENIKKHLEKTAAGDNISMALKKPDSAIAGHSFITGIRSDRPVFGIGLAEPVIGRGWGRKLMAAVLNDADKRGVSLITLTVFKDNMRARHLYESFGFVITGECKCRAPGDSLAMERRRPDDDGKST